MAEEAQQEDGRTVNATFDHSLSQNATYTIQAGTLIDPVNTLLLGTAEQVRAAATQCIEAAAQGGGYILSSACSVAPHTPPENILQLRRAADEVGA